MTKRFNFDKLRADLHLLNLQQAQQLYAELGAILLREGSTDMRATEQQVTTSQPVGMKRREVVETQRMGDRLYQLERVRCGKISCKCVGENGQLHGPYWYTYWRDDGKLKSHYVGKQLRQVESDGCVER